jgi:hypothetical protein
MNALRINYQALLLVWLVTATAGAFVAMAHALQAARFFY